MVLFVAEGSMMGNFGIRPLCGKWVVPDSNGHQERGTDPGSSSILELGGGTDNLPWMVANDPYRGWFTVALVSCRLFR
jgi:hypothetical protein